MQDVQINMRKEMDLDDENGLIALLIIMVIFIIVDPSRVKDPYGIMNVIGLAKITVDSLKQFLKK